MLCSPEGALDARPQGSAALAVGSTQRRSAPSPRVSVCLPAYNGERWIRSAIESVLAQTYDEFELVISDGGSQDDTVEVCRSYDDPRIRVDAAASRLDAVSNWNRSVLLARGEFIKFLHQDDTLYPDCLEEMVAVVLEDMRLGLVFAPREIVIGDSPSDADRAWASSYASLHRCFTNLDRINDGHELFRQLVESGFEGNWIGEPSSVLVTRRCLATIGLFNPRLRQVPDLDLWSRAMLSFRIGFVDHALSTYLHHASSLTTENDRRKRAWLDRLWLFEGLLAQSLPETDRARIESLRNEALRAAVRTQASRLLHGYVSTELADYAAFRARSSIGRAPTLNPPANFAKAPDPLPPLTRRSS